MSGASRTSAAPNAGARTRLIVAHADDAARHALRVLFARTPDVVVAADARDTVELVELARFYRPEAVLVDADLPRSGAAAAVGQLRTVFPMAVVVVSINGDDLQMGLAALRAGAAGFITDVEAVPAAVRTVVSGGAVISPGLALHLVEALRDASGSGMRPVRSALTAREWEVLDLLCANLSTREIAAALCLTEDTVYGHVKRILRKLGVKSRAEAINAAGVLRSAGQT